MLADQIADFVGEFVRGGFQFVAAVEIEQVRTRALLGHQWVEFAQEYRVFIVPNDHIAVSADQTGTERVMRIPKLHVSAVGGIADVKRVEHQDAAVVPCVHCIMQPLVPPRTHGREIRQGQACICPLLIGENGRADLHSVVIVGCAIGECGAAGGVNLAGVAVMCVHAASPLDRIRGCFSSPVRTVCDIIAGVFGRGWKLRGDGYDPS